MFVGVAITVITGLSFAIGFVGGDYGSRLVAAVGAALPLLIWLGGGVHDELTFGYSLVHLDEESARFGFYVGLVLVIGLAPISLGGAWIGYRAGLACRSR